MNRPLAALKLVRYRTNVLGAQSDRISLGERDYDKNCSMREEERGEEKYAGHPAKQLFENGVCVFSAGRIDQRVAPIYSET
jgi:hypothetical protein